MNGKIKQAIKKILLDYNITEDEFLKLLDAEITTGDFDRIRAERRTIEGMEYYNLMEIAGINRIARDREKLKPALRNKMRVRGIEYVLRKYNISAAGKDICRS